VTAFRRFAVMIVGLALAVTGGATVWLTTADAASPSSAPVPPTSQPTGSNITIHSAVDHNFCVEDQPAPSVPASEASMALCAAISSQQWTFADAAPGYVVLIGGSQGECLDFGTKVATYVSVLPCTFKGAERFYYDNNSGLIESTSGKECLQTTAAAQDAELMIEKCDATVKTQIWSLGH
jgi:hypothetical protein